MNGRILILGSTGILGQPVTRSLVATGYPVRVLVRDGGKAKQLSGGTVEIFEGDALVKGDVRKAMADCRAVHVSLPYWAELTAMQHVVDLAKSAGLERITYISATTAFEENRWFKLIDVKLRTESVLRASGIAHTVFCPTWAMETLRNFVRADRAVVILSKNPPPLHFFAAKDLGRMVAKSYADGRTLGKRLFVHGPESETLPGAIERFVRSCYPGLKIMRLRLWQARLIAKLTGNKALSEVAALIAYFDKVGELGDPTEANALLGAPKTTLNEWFAMQKAGAET